MLIAEVNRNPSTKELHQFGWVMLAGFGVVGLVLWYFGPDPNGLAWTGLFTQKLAIAFWVLGPLLWVASRLPRPAAAAVYVGWMTAAVFLGTVMTVALLSVLFVAILPLSLIRLGDPLRMKLRPPAESYWEDHVHHESTLERTIRPF